MSKRIDRNDIEQQLRALQGDVTGKVRSRQKELAITAGTAALVVLVVVFLLGSRRGKRRSTIVEIRRV